MKTNGLSHIGSQSVTILPNLIGIQDEFQDGTREKLQRIRRREEHEMKTKGNKQKLDFHPHQKKKSETLTTNE